MKTLATTLFALAGAASVSAQTKVYDIWGFAPGLDFGRSIVAVGDSSILPPQ